MATKIRELARQAASVRAEIAHKTKSSVNQESQNTSLKYRAGSRVIMTFEERQVYLQNSDYGKVLGLSALYARNEE
jgi:hypothetical protein